MAVHAPAASWRSAHQPDLTCSRHSQPHLTLLQVFMEDKHATLETWDLCDGEYTLRAKFCVRVVLIFFLRHFTLAPGPRSVCASCLALPTPPTNLLICSTCHTSALCRQGLRPRQQGLLQQQ